MGKIETLELKVVDVRKEDGATQIIAQTPQLRDVFLDTQAKLPSSVEVGANLKAEVEDKRVTSLYLGDKCIYSAKK
jgi:hypothetical protein